MVNEREIDNFLMFLQKRPTLRQKKIRKVAYFWQERKSITTFNCIFGPN
jgi:hypothetical protein